MNHIKIRGVADWIIVTLVVLYFLFVGLVCFLCYIAFQENNEMTYPFVIIGFLMIVLFFTILICYEIYHYLTIIEITSAGILITYPTKKIFKIPKEQIISFGLVGFGIRNVKMYFCAAPESEIKEFLKKHKQNSKRRFGKKLVEELEQTKAGQWKLSLATYLIWSKSPNVIFLDQFSEDFLIKTGSILSMDRTDTGAFFFIEG